MSKYEVNLKINVDSTEVDETIEKIKQLAEAIEVVNGLYLEDEQSRTATKIHIDEDLFKSVVLETLDANNITAGDWSKKSILGNKAKFIRQEFEEMDTRIKGRLNRSRY